MNYFFKFKLPIIFLLALVLRIISIYYYRDTEIANEWGIIVENLLNNNDIYKELFSAWDLVN